MKKLLAILALITLPAFAAEPTVEERLDEMTVSYGQCVATVGNASKQLRAQAARIAELEKKVAELEAKKKKE